MMYQKKSTDNPSHRFIKDAEETGDINPMNEAYLANK